MFCGESKVSFHRYSLVYISNEFLRTNSLILSQKEGIEEISEACYGEENDRIIGDWSLSVKHN